MSALAEYATFLNVSFVETAVGRRYRPLLRPDRASPPTALAASSGRSGTGFFDLDGYVIFDTDRVARPTPTGRHLVLHEIGHAMTLKHPGGSGDEEPFLAKAAENNKYSVMSYRDEPGRRRARRAISCSTTSPRSRPASAPTSTTAPATTSTPRRTAGCR